MKGFDELFWSQVGELNRDTNLAYTFGCDAYKAGAESRQGEIDELKQALNSALQAAKNVCIERDELQNRIDKALQHAIDAHSDLNIGMLAMVEILKGNQNDN